jgi:hypothetical protein
LHGDLFQLPFPWHRRQVDRIMKGPVVTVSMPVPLHWGHLQKKELNGVLSWSTEFH